MNNIDELLLEYSIRTYDVRRVDWNKLACYFRFGRDWKKIKFICRLKIFFNMAAIYSKLFCCVQWVHICLQIKNLLNIRWIDEIQVTCIRWATKGIMVDWAQRCSWRLLKFNNVDENAGLWDSESWTWKRTFQVVKRQLQDFGAPRITKFLFSRPRAFDTYILSTFHGLSILLGFSLRFE